MLESHMHRCWHDFGEVNGLLVTRTLTRSWREVSEIFPFWKGGSCQPRPSIYIQPNNNWGNCSTLATLTVYTTSPHRILCCAPLCNGQHGQGNTGILQPCRSSNCRPFANSNTSLWAECFQLPIYYTVFILNWHSVWPICNLRMLNHQLLRAERSPVYASWKGNLGRQREVNHPNT